MKNLLYSIFCIFSIIVFSQEPNDCMNAIQICGNQDINLDVSGIGNVQEIGSNACYSNEHNSLWIRLTIESAGTLGFTLTPASSSILEDYDFWVFGPTNSCNSLGSAIRCSTTNPNAANQGNNLTGMNGTETDTSEGPGNLGNSFVRWLDVLPNQTYYLVLDRPIGNSAFSLTWTGSAVIRNPFDELAFPFEEFDSPILACDDDFDGNTPFDFHTLDADFLNGNTGFTLGYYHNENDANTRLNPINGTANISSGTYFVRITDTASDCYELREIEVEVGSLAVSVEDYGMCDEDGDGNVTLDLATLTYTVNPDGAFQTTFFNSMAEAENGINAINSVVNMAIGSHSYYVRVDQTGNICSGVAPITIDVSPAIAIQDASMEICDDDFDEIVQVNLEDFVNELTLDNNATNTEFYPTLLDAQNQTNNINNWANYTVTENATVFYRFFNENCSSIAQLDLTVSITPTIESLAVNICDEDGDNNVTLDLLDFEYNETPNTGVVLTFYSTQNDAEMGNNALNSVQNLAPGNYTYYVRAELNSSQCVDIETITLSIQSPIQTQTAELEFCDEDHDGFYTANLSDFIPEVALSNNYTTVGYYPTLADAQAQTNALSNTAAYAIENGETIFYYFANESCEAITQITFTISPLPMIEPYETDVCDMDGDGVVDFDLANDFDYTITPVDIPYTLTFYSTYNDAEQEVNAINPQITTQSGDNIYYVRVEFDSDLCIAIGTITIGIQLPIETNDVDTYEFCDDNYDGLLTVDLSSFNADILVSNNSTGFAYFHTNEDALEDINEISNFQNYAVSDGEEIFVTFYNESCSAITSFDFTIFPKPNLGEDETITYCPEQAPIELTVSDEFSTYSWSHDASENSNTVYVEETGTYTVTVQNEFGCEDEKTFHLEYFDFPYITDVEVQDDDALVNGFGGPPVYYSIDNGETWQNSNQFYDLAAGVYYVQIRIDEGCISEPFLFIVIDIPNSFTPNGDGVNDTWNIPYLEAFESAQMIIYDRYGKVIFNRTVKEAFQWDGKYLGRSLPTTTYWYQIITPFQQGFQGWVFLKNRD